MIFIFIIFCLHNLFKFMIFLMDLMVILMENPVMIHVSILKVMN